MNGVNDDGAMPPAAAQTTPPVVPHVVEHGVQMLPVIMPVLEQRPYDPTTFFENLPVELRQILIREAYMARAAVIIAERQKENEANLKKLQENRPLFMAVRKQAKAEHQTGLIVAQREVDSFAQAIRQNERAMENLQQAARRVLEHWLRTHDTTYMTGLACEHFLTDWKNALDLLVTIMKDFITSIGDARNQMVSGYDKEHGIYSPQSLEALKRAVQVGAALDTDTSSLNQISDQHDQMFKGTIFEDPFPRLAMFDAEQHTANAATKPIGTLQKHFDRIKGYYEDLETQGVPALHQAIARAEQRRADTQESYMKTLWDGLRTEAHKHVDESKLNAVVEETEQLYLQGAYT